MKSTITNFIQAIADELKRLYPEKKIYVNEIPRGSDGNFFVGLIDSGQKKELDRMRKRTLQFEVLYFCRERDNMDYYEWSEVMYENFERIDIRKQGAETVSMPLRNQKARRNDNTAMFQFLFDAEFHFLRDAEEGPMMEALTLTERIEE